MSNRAGYIVAAAIFVVVTAGYIWLYLTPPECPRYAETLWRSGWVCAVRPL